METHIEVDASSVAQLVSELGGVPARYAPPLPVRSARAEKPRGASPRPDAALVTQVVEQIHDRFVVPAIRSGSVGAYVGFFKDHWGDFFDLVRALSVLGGKDEDSLSEFERASSETRELLKMAAERVAGAAAGHEADFAVATALNAIGLVRKFVEMKPPQDQAADRKCAADYNQAFAVHCFGAWSVLAVSWEKKGIDEGVVRMAFELLRYGALEAYCAAREGLDLRRTSDSLDLYPSASFTDEEFRLSLASGGRTAVGLEGAEKGAR